MLSAGKTLATVLSILFKKSQVLRDGQIAMQTWRRPTPHISNPQNSTDIANKRNRNPGHKNRNPLGVPEENVLCREARKDMKEGQASNVKAVSAWEEPLRSLGSPSQPGKPKMLKGPSTNSAILPSSLSPCLGSRCQATGSRISGSDTKAQDSKPRVRLRLQLRLPKVPGVLGRSHRRGFCVAL